MAKVFLLLMFVSLLLSLEINARNWTFIHIPKTGGGSIDNLFADHYQSLISAATHQDPTLQYHFKQSSDPIAPTLQVDKSLFCSKTTPLHCSSSLCPQNTCAWWHLPPFSFVEPVHPYFTKPIRFCVIRDPATRILSEYLYLARVRWMENNPQNFVKFLEKVRENQAVFNNNQRRRESVESDFKSFSVEDSTSCVLSPEHHCHHIPMSRYVEPFVNSEYIETLQNIMATDQTQSCLDIVELMSEMFGPSPSSPSSYKPTHLNCNFPIRFENYNEDLQRFLSRCVGNSLPSLPHLNQNENDHHESKNYLTQNAMQIIKDIYWEDYERFGYGHVLNYKTLDIIND